jgi:hypothetical protein
MAETQRMLFLFRHGHELEIFPLNQEWKQARRSEAGWTPMDMFHFYSQAGEIYDFLSEDVLRGAEPGLRHCYLQILEGGAKTVDERIIAFTQASIPAQISGDRRFLREPVIKVFLAILGMIAAPKLALSNRTPLSPSPMRRVLFIESEQAGRQQAGVKLVLGEVDAQRRLVRPVEAAAEGGCRVRCSPCEVAGPRVADLQ